MKQLLFILLLASTNFCLHAMEEEHDTIQLEDNSTTITERNNDETAEGFSSWKEQLAKYSPSKFHLTLAALAGFTYGFCALFMGDGDAVEYCSC